MIKLTKNNGAQGHVEIIMSFMLFVGALIFLFIFINPFAETDEVSIIKNVQDKIINNISLDVEKLSIITKDNDDCYNFNSDNYLGNYIEIKEVERKYTIYFGEVFKNSTSKKDCDPLNYILGIYSSEKMIVYEEIVNLVANYNSNYEGLKDSLKTTQDFSFSFKNKLNQEITELSVLKQPPVGINVEAKEFPVRVINSSADIQELILNIRAW